MVVAFYFRLHLAYFPRPVVAIFARPEHPLGIYAGCEEYHPFEHPAQSHTLSAHHHNEHSGQFLHHNSVRHGKVCYSGQCNQTLRQTYAVPKLFGYCRAYTGVKYRN